MVTAELCPLASEEKLKEKILKDVQIQTKEVIIFQKKTINKSSLNYPFKGYFDNNLIYFFELSEITRKKIEISIFYFVTARTLLNENIIKILIELKNTNLILLQLCKASENLIKSILVFSTMGTSKSHNLKYLISLLNIKNDIINLFCINLENLKLDTRSLYTSLRFPSSFIAKTPYEIYKNVDFTEFLNDVYYFLHSIECTLNKIIYSNRMEKRAKELGF